MPKVTHEARRIDLSGMSWEEVCIILQSFQGISQMPIYWQPGGTTLVFGTDRDGHNIITII